MSVFSITENHNVPKERMDLPLGAWRECGRAQGELTRRSEGKPGG